MPINDILEGEVNRLKNKGTPIEGYTDVRKLLKTRTSMSSPPPRPIIGTR